MPSGGGQVYDDEHIDCYILYTVPQSGITHTQTIACDNLDASARIMRRILYMRVPAGIKVPRRALLE